MGHSRFLKSPTAPKKIVSKAGSSARSITEPFSKMPSDEDVADFIGEDGVLLTAPPIGMFGT